MNSNLNLTIRRLRVAERKLGRNLARYMRAVDENSRKKLQALIQETERYIQQLETALRLPAPGGGFAQAA